MKQHAGTQRVLLPVIIVILLGIAASVSLFSVSSPTASTTVAETITATTTLYREQKEQVSEVCFSPGGDCSTRITYWIDRANRSIHAAVYSFTLDSVADALTRAKARGVEVKAVIERDQAGVSGSEYQRLKTVGINVRLDGNPNLMHNKVAIIDGSVIITGSYNWSFSAENRNDENLVIISDPSLATQYESQFQRIWENGSP